jgi:hypothetical protein
MGSLTDGAENRVLDWTVGNSTTAPTGPMKLALLTATGTDSSAGTEVSTGSYARQTITLTAAASGAFSNASDITFSGMPAVTVTGWAIYDSAGFRWWHGALTASKTVANAGDDFLVAAGDLDITLD